MGASNSIGEATRKRNFHQKKFSGGESCTKLDGVFRDTPIYIYYIYNILVYWFIGCCSRVVCYHIDAS